MTPKLLVACGRSDEDKISQKVRSERFLSDGVICGLIGEAEAEVAQAVVFDVLKSRWRQWCCSQQRLQMTPKKTRLLKSGTPKD